MDRSPSRRARLLARCEVLRSWWAGSQVVLATGVVPRSLSLPGWDHPKVASYVDVLQRRAAVGERVAIVGAGGIGFDVAEFLMHRADEAAAAAADALTAPSLPQTERG